MDVGLGSTLLAGDPRLVDHIVGEVKSQGIFDQFRKECIADVDTKPAYQNLRTRVESSVNTFLCKQIWKPDMNKNQLRENLRKHIHDAAYLDAGVERIVDQVVNPKVYSVFMPQIEDVVYKFLGIERPKDKEKNGTKSLKDLLPKDLDPVSPESDKNSLKDVSLESVDADITAASEKNDHSPKDIHKIEANLQSNENVNEGPVSDANAPNKQSENFENQSEGNSNNCSKNLSTPNLNLSAKSDEKTEEEEEDSPMFEPIDIMNFNESNDSHLSGISELTSHRSRSPDFTNDFSRDNLDFSNHDSQLSKVSSDSRLSIVTDFGLSNHASMPMPEVFKEENNKEKSVESADPKCGKDNFKEIRDVESNKLNMKEVKKSVDVVQSKENVQDPKDSKDLKSIKGSPDTTDRGIVDKNESKDFKDSKDQSKDSDNVKTKSSKDKGELKESKTHKDRDRDHKRRQSSHSSSKHDKTDKYSKDKYKERSEKSRDSLEKSKECLDKAKEVEKPREDKKDTDKKETATKDLKDIYKEKIRELREKKELTEKEKLAKDPKESKSSKESRDKKDSSRDRKDSKSSSSKSTSRHDEKSNKSDEKSISKSDTKSSSRGGESKESRNESKDRGRRDEKRQSKDNKESRKSHGSTKNDLLEKCEKSETKKDVKNGSQFKDSEKSERSDAKRDIKSDSQRSDVKKDSKTESQNKDYEKSEKSDPKKDSKSDSQSKERKRKDDKKSKTKDDHSSLRKNPNDRRSTDRDGSNGSNGKSSQKSSSSSIANSSKTSSANLTKESSGTSNSSSETSDNVDVSPSDGINVPTESIHKDDESENKINALKIKMTNENESKAGYYIESDVVPKRVDLGQTELSLPLKKRPLQADTTAPNPNDFKVKKPKFAKNFQEAKKLMKIRKKLEKQRLQEYEAAKVKFQMTSHSDKDELSLATATSRKSPVLSDDERVQIIEVTDDDYEEPYPQEKQSIISLENPLIFDPEAKLEHVPEKQSKLSAMERSIRQSLEDMISDKKLIESGTLSEDDDDSAAYMKTSQSKASLKTLQDVFELQKRSEQQSKPENKRHDSMEMKETSKAGLQASKKLYGAKSSPCEEEKSDEREKKFKKNTVKMGHNKHLTPPIDDNCNCLYFEADNERAVKFSMFLQSLELKVLEGITCPQNSSDTLENILESLGGQVVLASSKTMAPPMPKRKQSTSPLMDIILNNTNNNNNRHKIKELTPEEESNVIKKRKLGRPKKQRAIANVCAIQNLPNGENFVMPLSPESDVSASSEKNSLHLLKEDKSRQRSSQRYSSDDLYKPRPFFSSSSRRSRRSNQA